MSVVQEELEDEDYQQINNDETVISEESALIKKLTIEEKQIDIED